MQFCNFNLILLKRDIYIGDIQFNRLVSYANEDEEEEGEDLDRESDEHEADESKCMSIIFHMQYVEIKNRFLLPWYMKTLNLQLYRCIFIAYVDLQMHLSLLC